MTTRRALQLLLVLAAAVIVVAPTRSVQAQRLRAQVYVTQRKIPGRLSERQLIRFARGNHSKRLFETNEPELEDREWKANLVVRFNRPPGDREFQILFYDTQEGRRFVQSHNVYLDDPDQQTYVHRLRLTRPEFEPERRVELVVTVKRSEVGKRSLQLRGEKKRNTGEVSFGNEEAGGGAAKDDDSSKADEAPELEPNEPAIPEEEEIDVGDGPEDPISGDLDPGARHAAAQPSEANRSGGLCATGAAAPPHGPRALAAIALGVGLVLRRRRARRRRGARPRASRCPGSV